LISGEFKGEETISKAEASYSIIQTVMKKLIYASTFLRLLSQPMVPLSDNPQDCNELYPAIIGIEPFHSSYIATK
jgi:hypothetical protein